MNAALLLLVIPLVWGLKRGSTVCLATCGTAMAPMAISNRRGAIGPVLSEGAARAGILTLGGAVFGALAYLLADVAGVQNYIASAGRYAYLALAVMMLGAGAYWLAMFHSGDHAQPECSGKRSRLPGVLGTVSGLACLGEVALTLEGAAFSGIPGMLSGSLAGAAVAGGLAMFLFSIGSWLPTTLAVLLLGSSGIRKRPAAVRAGGMAASVAMLCVGAVMMWGTLPGIVG